MPYTYTNTMKTKTITVYVTEDFIQKGIKLDCGRCPVALALMDTGLVCRVKSSLIRFKGSSIKSPISVTRFVKNFDKGKLALPFNFQITVPL